MYGEIAVPAPNRLRAMRRAQKPTPWTQERLAHEIEQAARHLGIRVPGRRSLKVQVSRWENGHTVPDARNRELLRRVFRATDEELGFRRVAEREPVDFEPIAFRVSWAIGFEQAAAEWELDMNRRRFLRTSGYVAAASTTPALQWLVGQPEEIVRANGTILVGDAHIQGIKKMAEVFRDLDNRLGGAHARASVVHYLATEVAPLVREGRYSPAIGTRLLAATAEVVQLAGWMTCDAGEHLLGQRYMTHALRMALAAGDAPLGAEILAGLSHQASYFRDAAAAIDLARAAGKTARDHHLDALQAEAAVMEAHGHACAGEERQCARALLLAEVVLDRADRSSDAPWIGYFDEAYLAAKFGHCFKELGQPQVAVRFAQRSLEMNNSYVRGRAFNLSLLATVHAQAGDAEAACGVGDEAVGLAQGLQSARAREYIRTLQRELEPYRSTAVVTVFDRGVAQALGQPVEHGEEGDHRG